jgi:hypothetical protein
MKLTVLPLLLSLHAVATAQLLLRCYGCGPRVKLHRVPVVKKI